MTPEVVAVAPATPIERIAALMAEKKIKRVLVIADGALIGMVSRAEHRPSPGRADLMRRPPCNRGQ